MPTTITPSFFNSVTFARRMSSRRGSLIALIRSPAHSFAYSFQQIPGDGEHQKHERRAADDGHARRGIAYELRRDHADEEKNGDDGRSERRPPIGLAQARRVVGPG